MNALHDGAPCIRGREGVRASNLGVLFVLLKTYGQSFVRGENYAFVTCARHWLAFVLSVCVHVSRENVGGKRRRRRSKKKEPGGEGGDNIIPRLRVSVKKRITQ